MSEKHHKPLAAARSASSAKIADGCLIAALLLVLALSWQGTPPAQQDGGLQRAAHVALSRQLGAEPGPQMGTGATHSGPSQVATSAAPGRSTTFLAQKSGDTPRAAGSSVVP